MADLARIKQLADENKLDELRQIAMTQGLTPHHAMKANTVAKMILEKVAHPNQDKLKHPAETPVAKHAVANTEADIRRACAVYFDKPGFEATFNDDNTWHFKCRGAEDTGHMTVLLRVISMKAEMVSQGRRLPMGHPDFGKMPGADGPLNAYTNVVLTA